jgi:hypothetical protein
MDHKVSAYGARHPDSPIALAWDIAGPVHVDDVLRPDIAHAVSLKMLRQAYALGVVSATGLPADVHQTETCLWPDLAPTDYLATWITTACAWAREERRAAVDEPSDDANADRAEQNAIEHAGVVARWAADLVVDDQVPAWFVAWLGRTVHAPKFTYLVELGAWAWLGALEPVAPEAGWAVKVDRQWRTRAKRPS